MGSSPKPWGVKPWRMQALLHWRAMKRELVKRETLDDLGRRTLYDLNGVIQRLEGEQQREQENMRLHSGN